MEQPNSVVLCDNLIKWLQTLNLKAKHGNPSELSDGVAIAEALTQIAPEYFSPSWNTKIKTDVGHNWRLKVSNLKKILEGVVDYHQDILNLSLQEFSRPDVVNIAEHADPSDLGRLLQLVLSCAVNCEKKEEYITRIMELELSCQRSIMQAIQELETLTLGGNRGSSHADAAPEAADADMKEVLAQRCHELDTQVKILQEEKMTLLSEVARLTEARQEPGDVAELDDGGASLGPAHAGTLRYSNMRAQLDALKDELDKVELQRDDQRARADVLERELTIMKLKNEELQVAASETVILKDEVDALRETAAKAATLEATVASYKKRMEEHVDLRRQVKLLERANTEHVQRAIEQEQAAARANALRSQLDIYKKQVTDLNEKLDAEITKADKLEIENKKLSSQVTSVKRERDALLGERDTLRETVDELRCSTITPGASEDNVSRELIPNELKEKLIRLEHENKLLRQNQGAQADQASVQALLEDYAARMEKQRALNREANQRIMQLEAAMESPHPRLASAIEDSQRKSLQVEELQAAVAEERRRASKLQEALAAREAELVATEDKYKRCVEKAKEVIKSLDPRATGQPSLSDMTLGYSRAGAAGAAARADGTPPANRHESVYRTSPTPSLPGQPALSDMTLGYSRAGAAGAAARADGTPPANRHESVYRTSPTPSLPGQPALSDMTLGYSRAGAAGAAARADGTPPANRHESVYRTSPTPSLPGQPALSDMTLGYSRAGAAGAAARADGTPPANRHESVYRTSPTPSLPGQPALSDMTLGYSRAGAAGAAARADGTPPANRHESVYRTSPTPSLPGQPALSDMTLGYSRAGAAGAAARADGTPPANRHEWSGSSEDRGSTEQRLLVSAWYSLGERCQRDAVNARLALLSAGHSFLARQRRQPPRPRPAPAQ